MYLTQLSGGLLIPLFDPTGLTVNWPWFWALDFNTVIALLENTFVLLDVPIDWLPSDKTGVSLPYLKTNTKPKV